MTHIPYNLYVAFGLPGAGKTYAARVFTQFGFHMHDGDDDLPPLMRAAIDASQLVTDAMRDEFFGRIITHVHQLLPEHPRLALAQTFIKERYRVQFLEHFPLAQFVLLEANEAVRERRLIERTHQALDPDYARRMTAFFDPPLIPHHVIVNNQDGDAHLRAQIAAVLGV